MTLGDRFNSGARRLAFRCIGLLSVNAPRRMALLRAARRPSVRDATIRAGENPATYGALVQKRGLQRDRLRR